MILSPIARSIMIARHLIIGTIKNRIGSVNVKFKFEHGCVLCCSKPFHLLWMPSISGYFPEFSQFPVDTSR